VTGFRIADPHIHLVVLEVLREGAGKDISQYICDDMSSGSLFELACYKIKNLGDSKPVANKCSFLQTLIILYYGKWQHNSYTDKNTIRAAINLHHNKTQNGVKSKQTGITQNYTD